MRDILCYGDSNTWGYRPMDKKRYDVHTRWPGVLRDLLGPEYHVVEEGNNGRTPVWEDPVMEGKDGLAYLDPCLASHYPLDLVIIMLGTNAAKGRFSCNAWDIAKGVETLVKHVKKAECGPDGGIPEILMIAPPLIGFVPPDHPGTHAGLEFGMEAVEKSTLFAPYYKEIADANGVHYLDAALYCEPSKEDGLHLYADSHRRLGEAVYQKVLEIFGEKK